MAGAWVSQDGQVHLWVDGERCIQAEDRSQMLFELEYGPEYALRTEIRLDQPVPGGLEMRGGELVVVDPVEAAELHFRRLEGRPEALDIEPFALGQAHGDAAARKALASDLKLRDSVGRGLRTQVQERMREAQRQGLLNSFEAQLEFLSTPAMVALRQQLGLHDSRNAAYIEKLLRSRGWVTQEAFGAQAQLAAFNMVRFSNNLRVMRSVLPALEEELQSNKGLGYLYTLLYDSVQLSLGEQQLYGTILQPDLDGRMRLRRVRDKGALDDRRQEMGLPPIREFLANFEQIHGTIEVEGS